MSIIQTSSEIRNLFVEYFKRQGHSHQPSSSLIPENDPTLLFANAGMNQFKNTFLGLEKRAYNRAVTVQKCVRAGGKHNDLDNVGFTARHHTFFEMLGNFSFGDYFKKDAIHFAWEFLTKDLGIPKGRLYVTVFESDDEALDIWHKQEGIPRDRIFKLGEKDNFWRMGEIGPCGPCSEIFYDHGPEFGKETDPYKGIVAGEDRFIEIWNLVFMQFDETAPGKMQPLPKPSVDTGAGLERIVAAIQGRHNNYNTDLFLPMIEKACSVLKYDLQELLALEKQNKLDSVYNHQHSVRETLAALRVLADHTRAITFLLADGAMPSNEGRGYVLRRILRRAVRFGRKLSPEHSFLPMLSNILVDEMGGFYPELKNRQALIQTVLKDEESRFLQTLDSGTALLENELRQAAQKNQKVISGELAFKLYDTFGFPLDLTQVVAAEKGFTVDEKIFEQCKQQARELAKSSWKGNKNSSTEKNLTTWVNDLLQKNKPTEFTGYESLAGKQKILGLHDGNKPVEQLGEGATGFAVFAKTPFYSESGGQVGDHGKILGPQGSATVTDCFSVQGIYLHQLDISMGNLKTAEPVEQQVSLELRRKIKAHHSGTHLLHAALRKILGHHVQQAGSVVEINKFRFDFTHPKAMTRAELDQVQNLVNEQIQNALPVQTEVMKHNEAVKKGAMALFGEKYGDQVRVLTMGDFSCELCGGTHVSNTSEILALKITSESSVAAGVRRIEAVAGATAIEAFFLTDKKLSQLSQELQSEQPLEAVQKLQIEVKDLERKIGQLKKSQINISDLKSAARKLKTTDGLNFNLLVCDIPESDRDLLSKTLDQLRDQLQPAVVIILGEGGDNKSILIGCSAEISKALPAGMLLKNLSQKLGGKGGGRPDFAQGSVPAGSAADLVFKTLLTENKWTEV